MGNEVPEVSKKLAEFASSLQYEDLSSAAISEAKRGILDWWACSYGGANPALGDATVPGKIALEVSQEVEGPPQATILAQGHPLSDIVHATLINGILSHSLDMDDVHGGGVLHPSVGVLPAVYALGEKKGISGKEFILAYVLGYEVSARLGETVNPSSYYFWHTTGTCDTFGAAAGTGKILGLETKRMLDAFGSAGTQAAGLWEFLSNGSMSKPLHAGKAAMNGLLSSLLAEKGYTGANRIIEGEKGFVRAVAPQFDFDKVTKGLGERFKIEENCFKPYAACRHAHPSINAVLNLLNEKQFELGDIKEIEVNTNSVAYELIANWEPKTPYACKFSLPYCVITALKFNRLGPTEFSPELANDSLIQSFMSKVKIQVDPRLEAEYKADPLRWVAEVSITLNNGEIRKNRVDYPKGDALNPMTTDEIVAKLYEMGSWMLPQVKLKQLAENILNLENISDIRVLGNSLRS